MRVRCLSIRFPDVLPLTNGRKVTTKKEWVEKRRPELLRLFETQIYGKSSSSLEGLAFPATERR